MFDATRLPYAAMSLCCLAMWVAACEEEPGVSSTAPGGDVGDASCVDLAGDGCGEVGDVGDGEDVAPDVVPRCEAAGARVVEVWAQPSLAGGVDLGLAVTGPDGQALPGDLSGCLALETSAGASIPAAFERARPSEAKTAVVIWPGQAPEEALASARALVASRPFGEAVAVFVAGATVTRWIDFDVDPARLATRMQAAPSVEAVGPEALPSRVAEVVEAVSRVGTPGALVARQVVVVAPGVSEGGGLVDEGVPTFWWLADAPDGRLSARVVGGVAGEEGARALSERLDAYLGGALYRGRACPQAGSLAVVALGGESIGAVRLPERPAGEACDLELPLVGPDLPERALGLELDAEQRAIYDARVAALSREDFRLSVRPSPQREPLAAVGHLRGQSSLGCDRKSYAVHAEGEVPWLPELVRDEAVLLSMCLDHLYINQLTGDALMADLGIFPLSHGLRTLTLDGEPRGVYLVMDKPEEAARSHWLAPRSVIRRQIDIDGKPPELKWSAYGSDAALAEYDALLGFAGDESGDALLEGLKRRMDLDGYLRWIALMSLLENGDYVDEVWFVGTTVREPGGVEVPWFQVVGWDPDDLFSECHHAGRFAIVDPHGLLYCAESVLDHAIFADPVIYARYVEVLEEVMARVTPEVFTRTLEGVGERVLRALVDDGARGAMVELLRDWPAASTLEGAREVIIEGLQRLRSAFEARREELRAAIATWREGQP